MKSIPINNVLLFALMGLAASWLSGCVSAPERPAAEIVVPVEQPTESIPEVVVPPPPPVVTPEEPAEPAKPVVAKPPAYNPEDVVWIQQRLQELGYYTGAIDGRAGQATRSAIRAYQNDQRIEADGKPTNELRAFMWRNGG